MLTTSYILQAFPEALFHQLLIAMVHPDHETRVGAHHIFSVVLVPSSVSPHPSSSTQESSKSYDLTRTLSRTVSVFSSSAALFEKLRRDRSSFRENNFQKGDGRVSFRQDGQQDLKLNKLQSSKTRFYSVKRSTLPAVAENTSLSNTEKEMVYA